MLEHEDTSAMAGSHHVRVQTAGDSTATLPTNVEEIGACLICPIFGVRPVALLVSRIVLEIKVVFQVIKLQFGEVSWVNHR